MPAFDRITIDQIIEQVLDITYSSQVDYEYMGDIYSVHHNDIYITEYIDRFMEHYKVNQTAMESVTSIFVVENVEISHVCHRMLNQEDIFQMHIGKGERWDMKAKVSEYGDWRLVHQLNTGTVYFINSNTRTCIVLGSKESSLNEDVFHLMRSLMPRSSEAKGNSIFHAAGVRYQDRGIMIVGESGNGKTTTFIDFILQGAIPVSNDRIFIPSNTKVELAMFEWPSFINTSVGTLDKVKQLNHLLPDVHYERFEDLWYSKVKLPIEPPEFKRIFNVEYLKSSVIDVIIFPRLRPEQNTCELIRVDGYMASNLLRESCYSPDDPAYLNWHQYLNVSDSEVRSQSEDIIRRLTDTVPAFLLVGGADLSDGIQQISKMLDEGI
ncbi:hypothetical protein [Paenibacillus glacialis]|uniref:Uncharacterized protein n=1 Tax=Paenibacillus glacialis TaxID=494026 RepID=A0A168D0Y0_9BACL|nr:hypothetical protein [Paenibacillus glacialis]OAB33781.1 hypothetical protein PGLA_22890 [Paenibacillus glacialis]